MSSLLLKCHDLLCHGRRVFDTTTIPNKEVSWLILRERLGLVLTRRCLKAFRCSVALFLAAKAGRCVSRGCGDDKGEAISCGSRYDPDFAYQSRLLPPTFRAYLL